VNPGRRSLIAGALAALAASMARAAPPVGRTNRVGTLLPDDSRVSHLRRFEAALRERGYVEGSNLTLLRRFAENQYERLPRLAAELVAENVDVIVAGGTPATRAAQQATSRIPIVTVNTGDPVGAGMAASLARPGSNVTGFSIIAPEITRKGIELLLALAPRSRRIGILFNPDNAGNSLSLQAMDAAKAKEMGIEVVPIAVRRSQDLEPGLAKADQANALYVLQESVLISLYKRVAEIGLQRRLPCVSSQAGFVNAGGLASYGHSSIEQWQSIADFVDRILNGAKPADLPFRQPTQFDLTLNRGTARLLGITIPQELLLRASTVLD
jgi:putative ABC transport system substrate-binding protein